MHDYKKPQIWNVIWSRPYEIYERHHQVFWKEIRNRVRGNVLDLACGSGSCWRDLPPDIDITGVDFSNQACIEAKKNCPTGRFYPFDIIRTHLSSSTFDWVVLCGVVNYYHDTKKIMREAHRLTKMGGKIIVTINVIDDFPDRHWDEETIHRLFGQWGIHIETKFYEKIGWLVEIWKR